MTCFTPATRLAISAAACPSFSVTLPIRKTSPFSVSTFTSDSFTRLLFSNCARIFCGQPGISSCFISPKWFSRPYFIPYLHSPLNTICNLTGSFTCTTVWCLPCQQYSSPWYAVTMIRASSLSCESFDSARLTLASRISSSICVPALRGSPLTL